MARPKKSSKKVATPPKKANKAKKADKPKADKAPKAKKTAAKASDKPTRRRADALPFEKMNADQKAVIQALQVAGVPLRNSEITERAFADLAKQNPKRASSHMRNALRGLRNYSWIFSVGGVGSGVWRGHWMAATLKPAPLPLETAPAAEQASA